MDLSSLQAAAAAGQRVALVTGANKGIGRATALGLAQRHIAVLLGSRDLRRGEDAAAELEAPGLLIAPIQLDIVDIASVARAAERISDSFGRLDILVNNAAVKFEYKHAPPSSADMGMIRETYETNVFGTMHVLQAMVPLLRRAPSGRIVNVSSGLGSKTLATTDGTIYQKAAFLGYNTTKAALNSISVQFANELRDTPIKVNIADPGYTQTDMTRHDGDRTPEQAAEVIIRLATLDDDGPTAGYFDEHGVVPW